jgi:endonuclease/exonuclease/phosphatase family metal-dependent hydrolase
MIPTLSVACLNIEMSAHLETVCNFLSRHKPEVVCVQELFERDVRQLSAALDGAKYVFGPMTRRANENLVMGIALFSRLPTTHASQLFYRGSPDRLPRFDPTTAQTKSQTQNHLVIACDVEKDNASFRIGTTHFPWTPDGRADDVQRNDLKILLEILDPLEEFVLCGDFNFPRGGDLFDVMAVRFKDNIPTRYLTSIDPILHRSGALELMVDGVFSTPGYSVSDVELHTGISDHCAITFNVSRPL